MKRWDKRKEKKKETGKVIRRKKASMWYNNSQTLPSPLKKPHEAHVHFTIHLYHYHQQQHHHHFILYFQPLILDLPSALCPSTWQTSSTLKTSGTNPQGTAAGCCPIYACTLAVTCCFLSNIPRATGRATGAAGDC